jgi:hypothetical protein
VAPFSEPHVLVATFAQQGGRNNKPGIITGSIGALHVAVPHATGAIAPVPAVPPPKPPDATPPPKPAVTCGPGVVPSSPPHPNTLTRPASATAVHHALFIAGNPLRVHGRAPAPGEQLSITECDISVHGYCSKGGPTATRSSRVLTFRRKAAQSADYASRSFLVAVLGRISRMLTRSRVALQWTVPPTRCSAAAN